MARKLRHTAAAGLMALAGLPGQAMAELSDRHELEIRLNWSLVDTGSELGAWTEGAPGKLLTDRDSAPDALSRLTLQYRGELAPQWFAHAVIDYLETADEPIGATEAYIEWRPLPDGPNRHRFRFGAFYPEFSYENADFAWESPYSQSFSSINAWIGEEIRPLGAGWRLSRPLGAQGSPHEIGAFAGSFVGNDTAATLLFWRGWSVHDRQTRLNERLTLPTLYFPTGPGGPTIAVKRELDPIAEIDDAAGFYVGGEWSYARRAKLAVAHWDNRADPYAYRGGQWAWNTRFWHLATQLALPARIGLVAQYLRGDTDWLIEVGPDGTTSSDTYLATDEFESAFLLLSRPLRDRHRLSVRLDRFDIWRADTLKVDNGTAWTLAYEFKASNTLSLRAEWLRIASTRDLWPLFLGFGESRQTERMLRLGFDLVLFDSTG